MVRGKQGYTVEMESLPARLAVRADPETARRLFHTLLCLFPSPSSLSIRFRDAEGDHTWGKAAVSRAAIAEAFESLSEFVVSGQRIQVIVASDEIGAEMSVTGGGEIRVTAEDIGPFEKVVEEYDLPALRRGSVPATPRLGPASHLGGEAATLDNTLERLRLTPKSH